MDIKILAISSLSDGMTLEQSFGSVSAIVKGAITPNGEGQDALNNALRKTVREKFHGANAVMNVRMSDTMCEGRLGTKIEGEAVCISGPF